MFADDDPKKGIKVVYRLDVEQNHLTPEGNRNHPRVSEPVKKIEGYLISALYTYCKGRYMILRNIPKAQRSELDQNEFEELEKIITKFP